MPQQVPFFFVNQATAVALMLGFVVYVFSVYVMPPLLQLWVTRLYVTKL